MAARRTPGREVFTGCLVASALLASASAAAAGPAERADRIARSSPVVMEHWRKLEAAARGIRDRSVREVVLELLASPAPTFVSPGDLAQMEARRQALVQAGLLDPSVPLTALFPVPLGAGQSFLATAGSTLDGHHAYPGGLVEHTLFDVLAAEALSRTYAETAGVASIDADTLVAAVLLHDVMKPYAMAWRPDGTQALQATVAGTASHHIFAIAEAIHRKLPARLVVALAGAHDAPGTAEARVVGFLRAGALLAGEDAAAIGLVQRRPDGTFALAEPPSFEASICHLADHDYVLAEPSAHAVNRVLDDLLREAAPASTPEQRRWGRYRIEARVPSLRLYAALLQGGAPAVRRLISDARVPLAAASEP